MSLVRKTLLILLLLLIVSSCVAEKEPTEVWILCQPDSYVNVRMFPKKDGQEIGRHELGDMAWTDGKKKNGFLHLIDLHFECDGWISVGFISRTPVVRGKTAAKIASRGRVRARRSVKGSRRKWVKNQQEIIVYGHGDEWAVTNEGFIQMKFIEMEENSNGEDTFQ